MIPYERRKIMLMELEKREVVNLEEFCISLNGVSESTVRRDLKTLENEGQVILLRGGAAKMRTGSYDTPVNSRALLHVRQKEIIAQTAAALVKDGEVIYVDAGSTCLRMLPFLKEKRITMVTSNAMVFPEIVDSELTCTLLGGDILKVTASIVGPITDNMLRNMFFDKAFIGATGYDLQSGINTPDAREANKKSIVKENSQEIYVLMDSSKEGIKTMCKAFELNECILITERETELLRQHAKYIVAR